MLVVDVKGETQRAWRRARFAVVLSWLSVVVSLIALGVAVQHEAVWSAASHAAASSGQPPPLYRGRVALGVAPQGSHRSRRARLRRIWFVIS